MRIIMATVVVATVAAPAAAIELTFPVDCTIGTDCAIQHYADHDPSKGARDFRCGGQTYDGHDGTDIRIPTLRRMRAGVAVLAAADGTVARTRDDMPDRMVEDPETVADRECGNGVIIDHGDGFETQYCHMKHGSIAVTPGTRVAAGTPIGEIGLSGNTEFPHLHFSVRREGDDVDPFATAAIVADAACTPAEDAGLWSEEAAAMLDYRPATVLNVGFADGAVTMQDVESGALQDIRLGPRSDALVFFGRAIGLDTGDRQRLVVVGPDGEVFTSDEVEPLERAKAQYFAFVGKRRSDPDQSWSPGTYRGRYSVIRDGEEIAFDTAEIRIAGPSGN